MQRIALKSLIKPVIIFIVGVILSITLTITPILTMNMELPLLIIGIYALFLSLNFLIFSKATAKQVILLSLVNLLLFCCIAAISLFVSSLTDIKTIEFSINLSISPLFIIINSLTSIIIVYTSIKFEEINKIKKMPIKSNSEQQALSNQNTLIKEDNPIISLEIGFNEEITQEEQPTEAPLINQADHITELQQEENQEELFFEENNSILEPQQSLNINEPLQNDNDNEIFLEENLVQEKQEIIFDSGLGDLPDINLDDSETSNKELKTENNKQIKYDESIFEEDYKDYIPENIRLVEKSGTKKTENTGQISSIGKLLINKKDIENIIEMNEQSQIPEDKDNSNIVTRALGEKLKESLTQIEKEYSQIKNSTISNNAGFTIASLINDSSTEQTVGALASGAFMTLQNYLSRIGIDQINKIFFETDACTHILIKFDSFIFYFNCEKEFDTINYASLKEIITQNELSSVTTDSIKDINGVIESVLQDTNCCLLDSYNSSNPEKLASVASAVFENLKVFITNIQTDKLEKITIFTNNKVLAIKKYNDGLITLITELGEPIMLSDKISKIEELIK